MLRYIKYTLLIVGVFYCYSWGFHAHKIINKQAVYSLPFPLQDFFLDHIIKIEAEAVRADKRRYLIKDEACRHYIDLDLFGSSPLDSIPASWALAKEKYGEDTLKERGILPWVIYWEYTKLVWAMDSGTIQDVILIASDLGHYVADACVPLHTTHNYNGQHTNQKGIHALWESRIPESFSKNYNFYLGKAVYLEDPRIYAWQLINESHSLVDSVLMMEAALTSKFSKEKKYRFSNKNGKNKADYSTEFIGAYNVILDGMVERRLQRAILSLSSFWYSAWVDAGQPNLKENNDRWEISNQKHEVKIIPKRIHE